ncbi:hypothetical protein [Lacinutrix mariniflava]|uniref:hypothetical protein n=1 Tax=Lacinutrix mariniflava TaxID=342955 RepID=UPI0006E40F2F|nr:hypothetical protein [Lacinutrix mariniflava]
MESNFLLKNEFENWLQNQGELLYYKPSFYSNQITKLEQSEYFTANTIGFFESLENEILCDNHSGVEDIIVNRLSVIEEKVTFNSFKTVDNKWNGLRLGLLKYRLFLHSFIAMKHANYKGGISCSFDDVEPKRIRAFFNSRESYMLPIYHDVYTYNKSNVDYVWQQFIKTNKDNESENKDSQSVLQSDFETIIVKKGKEGHLEIVNGGNTVIMIFLLLHVLNEFSICENTLQNSKKSIPNLFRLQFATKLNEQKFFNVLVRNKIFKKATTANEIIKRMPYNFNTFSLNGGYHFLETTFRFVQLIHESKIPQSEKYIPDLGVFIKKILKNKIINVKELIHEDCDKTYLNYEDYLVATIMEWL